MIVLHPLIQLENEGACLRPAASRRRANENNMSGFIQKFRRDVVGIAWLAASLFLGLALFSFKSSDPSFNSTGLNLKVQNYCGYIGSFAADLMYQAWGLAAWILVFAAVRMCVRTFQGRTGQWIGVRLVWAGLLLITVSSLLGLYFPATRFYAGSIPAGGVVGLVVAKALVSAFNSVGVSIILWGLALMLLVFYTERPLRELFKAPISFVRSARGLIVDKSVAFRRLLEFDNLKPLAAAGPAPTAVSTSEAQEEKKKGFRFPLAGVIKAKPKAEEREDE